MTQRELKESIQSDPNLTDAEKSKALRQLEKPYRELTDAELLQLVRDFVAENNRMPGRADLVYDGVLKQRFGPWARMLEKAGVKEVSEVYLERHRRRREKHIRQREFRKERHKAGPVETIRAASAKEAEVLTQKQGIQEAPAD